MLFEPGGWKYHWATVPATTYTRSSANSSTCARRNGISDGLQRRAGVRWQSGKYSEEQRTVGNGGNAS